MGKFLLLSVYALLGASVAQAYGGGGGRRGGGDVKRTYQVTVLNLTKGQPLTPPLIVAHKYSLKVYQLGGQASDGLADLAQDGITATLRAELDNSRDVLATKVGNGVIMPGEKHTYVIDVPRRGRPTFSVLSMLARTNDAFIAATISGGRKGLAQVYDAGVEHNTENCAHIPAPPCGNHNVGTDGGEGFVRPHEGLHLSGNLDGQRDTFANVAARIEIKLIK